MKPRRPSLVSAALERMEADAIQQWLVYFEGDVKKAAHAWGVSRTTLYAKAKKYGIDIDKIRQEKQ